MGIAVLRAEHNDDIRLLAIGKLNRLIQHHKAEAVAFDATFRPGVRDSDTFIKHVIGAMMQGIIDHRLAVICRDIAFCNQRAGRQLDHLLPVGLRDADLNRIGLNKQFFYRHYHFLYITANNVT